MSLCPEPLLSAFDRFSGSFTDLELGVKVAAPEFAKSYQTLARKLEGLAVRPCDRIILAIRNGPRFAVAFGASLKVGASPLFVHFESPPAELKRIATRYQAKFLFCDQWASSELTSIASCVHEVEVAPWARWQLAELSVDIDSTEKAFPDLPAIPLHPTSGTSGDPKIAVRPASAAVAEALHYIETIGINNRDKVLATVPMSHAYGFGMCMMVPLLCSGDVVSTRSFNPKQVQRALHQESVTIFPAVPAMLDILAKDGSAMPFKRPIKIFAAGSAVTEAVANTFEAQYGLGIHPLYGTTETGGISVARMPSRGLDVNAVGAPLCGVSVSLSSNKEAVGVTEGIGSIRVRSESMMAGYLTQGGIDTSMLDDGWFDVGDLATLDDLSVIRLYGRDSDVINIFGMKVMPYEVEEVIREIPYVKEVIVYKGLHRSGSQLVKAAVVACGPLAISEIRSYCEQNLSPYKRPQFISVLDELPKTAAGKVIRAQLP